MGRKFGLSCFRPAGGTLTRTELWLFLAISLLAPFPARAQSIWVPRDEKHVLLFEALHTSMERFDEDFSTGIVYLSGRFELDRTMALVMELPEIHVDAVFLDSFGDYTLNGDAGGNPYIGIELRPRGSDVFIELGARAPLMPDDQPDAVALGSYADQSRIAVFVPSTTPVQLVLNMRHVTNAGLLTRLRFGPVLAIPTEDTDRRDLELHVVFGWQIGFEGRAVRVGGAITGRSLITEGYPPPGARTTSQFEFHGDFGNWTFRPGLDLRLPIGSAANLVSLVVGGSLGASW